VVALLAEIAAVEELGLDLFPRSVQSRRRISPTPYRRDEVASTDRIIVKLVEWSDTDTRATMPYVRLLVLHRFTLVLVLLRDANNELGGLRINTPLS
jgi:hypothetical protein